MAFNRLQSPSRSIHLLNRRLFWELILIGWSIISWPRNESVLHVTSSCTIRSFSCLFSKSAEPCSFENSLRRHWTADSVEMIWNSWKENMCHRQDYWPPRTCDILEGLSSSFFGPPEWISSVCCLPFTTSFQSLFHQPLNNEHISIVLESERNVKLNPVQVFCDSLYINVHLDHRIHVDEVKALDLVRFYRMRTFHLGKWLLGEPLKISLLMQQCKLL